MNNLYPPYQKGGAETVVRMAAEAFLKEGDEVFIVSTRPSTGAAKELDARVPVYRVSSRYYDLDTMPVFFRLFWHLIDMFDLVMAYKLYKIFIQEKPDLVITHNLKGVSYLVPALLHFMKIFHIHTLHDIQLIHPSGLMFYGKEELIRSWSARFYQAFCRLLFSSPDVVISPSAWLLYLYESLGFFPNSIKKTLRNPVARTRGNIQAANENSEGFFTFLFVGQMEEHKAPRDVVRAYSSLPADIAAGTKLRLVGDGKLAVELKEMEFDARIKFVGKLPLEGVYSELQNADCLVVPSLCYENSPTVIYEAIASGTPFIASDLGGITELANEYGGILFKPGDIEDLSRAMSRMKQGYSDHEKKILESKAKVLRLNPSFYANEIKRLFQTSKK